MSKYIDTDISDTFLDYIKTNGDVLCACGTLPTDYTTATATYKLAIKTGLTSGDYTGPATGDAGGNSRKLTVNQQATLLIDTSGTLNYVAICSSAASGTLLWVTTTTGLVLTANGSNTVTIPAFKIELADIT
jgi:hypothetical protein